MTDEQKLSSTTSSPGRLFRIVLDTCVWKWAQERSHFDELLELGGKGITWLLPWEINSDRTLSAELEQYLGQVDYNRLLTESGGPRRIELTAGDEEEVWKIYRRHPKYKRNPPRRSGKLCPYANLGEAAGIFVARKQSAWFATREKEAFELAKGILGEEHAFLKWDLFTRLNAEGVYLPGKLKPQKPKRSSKRS